MWRLTKSQPAREPQGNFHPGAEVIVKCRFILRFCKPRNLLDIQSFSCIGCRRTPSFNEESSQTTQVGYSFRSFQTKPRNYCYLFSTPPCPSFIQVKTALACRAGARACEVSGRSSPAAIPARFDAS